MKVAMKKPVIKKHTIKRRSMKMTFKRPRAYSSSLKLPNTTSSLTRLLTSLLAPQTPFDASPTSIMSADHALTRIVSSDFFSLVSTSTPWWPAELNIKTLLWVVD